MLRRFNSHTFARNRGWSARAFARFLPDRDRFTDEEILTVIRAGDAGLNVADLCGAVGMRLATYCVLKAKYGGLAPGELQERRLRERRKRRALAIAVVWAFAGVGISSVLIAIWSSTPSSGATASAPRSPVDNATPTALRSPVEALPAPVPSPGAVPDARANRPSVPTAHAGEPNLAEITGGGTLANTEHLEPADPNSYSVQVAAVPDLEEAQAVLEQLARARYRAYLIPTIINQVQLFRVRVGPLESREVAQETVRRLEREGHHAPWVTK